VAQAPTRKASARKPDHARTGFANPRNIKELFVHRLSILANVIGRVAALENHRRFGCSLLDWRLIGLLAQAAPKSLNQLAREANLEKSQASRAVAKLIDAGLVERGADASDGRGVQLKLSAKGRQLYARMLPASVERSEAILAALDTHERAALEKTLEKLTRRVLDMLAEERARQASARGPANRRTHRVARKKR